MDALLVGTAGAVQEVDRVEDWLIPSGQIGTDAVAPILMLDAHGLPWARGDDRVTACPGRRLPASFSARVCGLASAESWSSGG